MFYRAQGTVLSGISCTIVSLHCQTGYLQQNFPGITKVRRTFGCSKHSLYFCSMELSITPEFVLAIVVLLDMVSESYNKSTKLPLYLLERMLLSRYFVILTLNQCCKYGEFKINLVAACYYSRGDIGFYDGSYVRQSHFVQSVVVHAFCSGGLLTY